MESKNDDKTILWEWVCYIENAGPEPWTLSEWSDALTPASWHTLD